MIQEYEARIAVLERLVGKQALKLEFQKGALGQGRRRMLLSVENCPPIGGDRRPKLMEWTPPPPGLVTPPPWHIAMPSGGGVHSINFGRRLGVNIESRLTLAEHLTIEVAGSRLSSEQFDVALQSRTLAPDLHGVDLGPRCAWQLHSNRDRASLMLFSSPNHFTVGDVDDACLNPG